MSAEGHGVQVTGSGAQAFLKLHTSRTPFDLVITDHRMPGSFSGLDLVRVARAKGFAGHFFVCSGCLSPELEAAYRRAGVSGFFAKPFNFDEISAGLRTLRRAERSIPRRAILAKLLERGQRTSAAAPSGSA